MSHFSKLSRTSKIILGTLATYSSIELYFYYQTRRIVSERLENYDAASSLAVDKFKSASVNGVFVNPFKEYRPQTAFEFLTVRLMEFAESFYANNVEIHDMYPSPDGVYAEVGDLLKSFQPNYDLMRHNSKIFGECLTSGSFEKLMEAQKGTAYPSINQQMLFTWLGQSCSLIQIGGLNILTDPIFGEHLFTNNVGPKRLVKSPMSLSDVQYATNNHLDIILVSHNHPDHLDMNAVKKIGNSAVWIVPLGLKSRLSRKGIYNVIEMDWWDSVSLNQILKRKYNHDLPNEFEIVCLPAMHWSGRFVLDANVSLWASFMVRRNGKSLLYHAGDTGYTKELFEYVGQSLGPVYFSLLPIGQYCPSWHQKPRHISPNESAKIASSLGSKHVMGVHFGTFKLSSEPILEPKNKFLDLAKHLNLSDFYRVPEFGQTYEYRLPEELPNPKVK